MSVLIIDKYCFRPLPPLPPKTTNCINLKIIGRERLATFYNIEYLSLIVFIYIFM